MLLTDKELGVIKDLRDQEETCIQKYEFYSQSANDQELKTLFTTLKSKEQTHYDSLTQVLNGTVPAVNSTDNTASSYNPVATYTSGSEDEKKEHDAFLCTDSIASEKYVSGAYNFDLFQFSNTNVRKLLNNIETEEQNHAEMIYKYKTVNGMA